MEKIQIIALGGSVLFLLFIFELIRRKKLLEAYALIWFLMGAVFIFISVFTNLLIKFSTFIGIYYPPATLFLLLIIGIIMILVQLSIIISKQNKNIKDLTQKVAVLEKKIND